MLVRDLKLPIVAAKADWMSGAVWMGFTPTGTGPDAVGKCQATIQRQFKDGYVLEYVTKGIDPPNEPYASSPEFAQEKEEHEKLAGRFAAIHRLKYTARSLIEIIGSDEYNKLQNNWDRKGERNRWSVAFPIIETYRFVDPPNALDCIGEKYYASIFKHSSATLRPLQETIKELIAGYEIYRVSNRNFLIVQDEDYEKAMRSDIDPKVARLIERDLRVLEGLSEEKIRKIKRRASWIADAFVRQRARESRMHCDVCGFDCTKSHPGLTGKNVRTAFDAHHKTPLAEGERETTTDDFALLCPTCHRVEHIYLRNGLGTLLK